MENRLKRFKNIAETFFIATLMGASLLLIFTTINFLGFQMFVVRSGSMEPAIKTGAVVFDFKKANYQTNDVITFKSKDSTVTHRITEIKNDQYIVKGDANTTTDIDPVERSQVIGQVVFSIPYLGFFVDFLRSFYGLIIFIIIPAAILVYEELKTIGREVGNLKNEKAAKKNKVAASTLFLGVVMALGFSSTAAYFTDSKVITGNVISTGYWGLIINEVYPSVAAQKGTEGKNDWVELYNPTTEAINLKGYVLVTKMGYFPITTNAIEIPAGGYVLIAHDQSTWKLWGVEKDVKTVNLPGNYNKPDWLIGANDYLQLKNPEGQKVDEVSFSNIKDTESYARHNDVWSTDSTPTPGLINN